MALTLGTWRVVDRTVGLQPITATSAMAYEQVAQVSADPSPADLPSRERRHLAAREPRVGPRQNGQHVPVCTGYHR